MDVRGGMVDRVRMFAKEIVDLRPDIILSISTPATAAVQRETQTIPIVFAAVGNPVGDGFVASLSRPGGNMTGFMIQEPAIAGRWLELLTEIAPRVTRAAAMINPETSPGGGSYFVAEFEAAARSLKVASVIAVVHGDADVEDLIAGLGREPGGGLVVTPSVFMNNRRASIISLALRHNVPAVYRDAVYVKEGGLLSYGPDVGDIIRRAAPYVDRILRGAKPAELPVQLPVKFEMALNMKAAKGLGLTVPTTLLAVADEVIE
jgi:putative tryptophan/tyrosine transport system substrate-binding protein